MRIAQVTDRFQIGGGLEHIYQIARGMPRHEFMVFGSGGTAGPKFDALDHVVLDDAGYSPRRIARYRPHIVHFHHLKPLLHYFSPPKPTARIPSVFTVHGVHLHKYQFQPSLANRLKFYLRKSLEAFLYRRVDALVSVSREDLQYVEALYGLSGGHYIPNGIAPLPVVSEADRSLNTIRAALGIAASDIVFLTVARFDFQKGYDILIDAISRLAGRSIGKPLHFLFAGDGEMMTAMHKRASAVDHPNIRIQFLGRREDIYTLMRSANMLVLPSRWEGLPITLIEAGFAGLPVIASDTFGNREIISHGHNGLLFENQSAQQLCETLYAILEGRFDLKRYAQALQQHVKETYTLSEMISRLQALYEQLEGRP